MESRALQLALMGMKNILAISGDYSGQGFGGQGAPVFDLDSVHLQVMLALLTERIQAAGDPDGFFSGCAVSPFKYTEGESFAQYAKLCRKMAAGALFVITQLGFDALKFAELIQMIKCMGALIPVIGSVYVLTAGSARIMNARKVPGVVVSNQLGAQVEFEWRNKADGRRASIERSARLAAVLRGLGYRGVHIAAGFIKISKPWGASWTALRSSRISGRSSCPSSPLVRRTVSMPLASGPARNRPLPGSVAGSTISKYWSACATPSSKECTICFSTATMPWHPFMPASAVT